MDPRYCLWLQENPAHQTSLFPGIPRFPDLLWGEEPRPSFLISSARVSFIVKLVKLGLACTWNHEGVTISQKFNPYCMTEYREKKVWVADAFKEQHLPYKSIKGTQMSLENVPTAP